MHSDKKDDKVSDPETLDGSGLGTIAGISEKELDSAAMLTDAIVGWALKELSLSKMMTLITLSSARTAKLMKLLPSAHLFPLRRPQNTLRCQRYSS